MTKRKNAFSRAFDGHCEPGDTISCAVEGFWVTARIEQDDDAGAPDEIEDGFWPSRDPQAAGWVPPQRFAAEQRKATRTMNAWKRGEWFYVGIVLSVERNGIILDKHAASLWGIECNYPGTKNKYLTEVANELLPEAIEHAKGIIRKLTVPTS